MQRTTDHKLPEKKNPANARRGAAARANGNYMAAAVGDPYGEHSTFSPGSVLQDRFRILRFLARGGAGEVYEAFDTELRCPVAIKLVRPEVATNESAIERFRREIALARQVTHPNVSRIFDVFRVDVPSPTPGQRPTSSLFLSMELLVGESLAARLHRLGPLNQAQALPLIIDMIEGLKAAHRAGVVHRDLKSANIMLARSGDEVRAVIMDFGLALHQTSNPDDPDPLTNSGVVVGTPNYMSPEQLTGGAITPAVDQYSLGIVLFEMLTGERPFRGENEVSTAVKRLTEPAPSPRSIVPELDVHWERAILKMLQIDPEDRFARLDDIIYSLVGTTMPIALSGVAPKRRRVRPSVLFTSGGLVLLAIALSQAAPQISQRMFGAQSLAQTLAATNGSAPLTIGSIQPEVVPEAYHWMTSALSGLLAYTLHGEGIDVSWVPTTTSGDPDPVIERNRLNASLFVGGSYLLDPALQRVTVDLTFIDDSVQRQVQAQGSANQLIEVAQEAARKIRRAAGLKKAINPTEPGVTLRRVAERELRAGRNLSALRLLEEGRRLRDRQGNASSDTALLAELALVLKQAGDLDSATEVASAALAMVNSDRRGRLSAEAAAAFVQGDWETANQNLLALQRFFPKDSHYALRRSEVLIEMDRPTEALRVLDQIASTQPSPSMAGQLLRARAENAEASYDAAARAAQQAINLGRSGASDWPLGAALLELGRSRIGQGDVGLGMASLEEADQWLEKTGGRPVRIQVIETLLAGEQRRGSPATVASLQARLNKLKSIN